MFSVFLSVLITNVLATLGILYSIYSPKNRIWPPPRMGSWQFWSFIVIDLSCTLGVPVVGFLDRGSLGMPYDVLLLLGALMILIGCSLIFWAVRTLGLHQSFGFKGGLVTDGPYGYSRNPQYVGFILFFIGVILFTDSFQALVTGSLVILWLVLAPFSEEPWLRHQYGKQYDEYCEKVPRFICVRSRASSFPYEGF